jgi:activating signal cointegrator 1
MIAMTDAPDFFEQTLPAISLWQPWASLWLTDAKIHETRHWATSHRGWLLVHAAKRIELDHGDRLNDILDGLFGHHWGLDLPRGCIIGAVRLTGCIPTRAMPIGHRSTDDFECGNFELGRFAWSRSDFERFKSCIPYRGQQGFFKVSLAKVGRK